MYSVFRLTRITTRSHNLQKDNVDYVFLRYVQPNSALFGIIYLVISRQMYIP